MNDEAKTKEQLVAELAALRRRIDALETLNGELQLSTSRAILQAVIESLPFDFFAIGLDGRYLIQNAASKRHWGQAIGKRPEDVAGSEATCARWLENNRRAFAGEKVEEEIELTVDDEKRFYYNVVAPIREDDHIRGILGINVDITKRKRAEEALQQARNELERRVKERTAELTKANEELVFFRKFAEASGQGFGIGDLDARITYVNPTMCRLMGEDKPENAIGKSYLAYYPEDWNERQRNEVIPALERDGRWQGEQAVLSRQGKLIPTLQDVFLLRDEQGEPIRRAVVVTDITDLKAKEEALRQSVDELRAIYDQVADGIIIVDAERGNPVRTNAAYRQIVGYSEEEARSLSPERLHPPQALPLVREHLDSVKRGLVARLENVPFLHRNGSVFFVDVVSSPICYNRRPCWISFFHDVTERKQAEEALKRESRTLKHLLQSSDHERQVIAYEIHDELAQQLAGAIMQFQTYTHLKDTKPKLAVPAYDAGMTMLRQGHAEARRLISGVRPPILDESGVVAAVAHLVNEQRLQNGPTIELLSQVEFNRLAPILENAVYRIVQEALLNACRHSRSPRVRIELVQREEHLRIKVRDWGVGFDPAGIEEGRFGLHGIRERARLLGGSSTLETAAREGTCITVELPLVIEE